METGKGSQFRVCCSKDIGYCNKKSAKQRRLQRREKRGLQVSTEEAVEVTHSRDVRDGLGHVFGFLP